jgi:two-component system NarL family sensor kinase
MSDRMQQDEGATLALALLRATLVVVIFVSEQLVDARQLEGSGFFAVLGVAAGYALAGIVVAALGRGGAASRALARVQPGLDVALLAGLAFTSGGAYSDVRKAFFVIPLAAAFSERRSTSANWSLIAVVTFSLQAFLAGGHPAGARNSWQRLIVNQDLYLAWTGAAASLLAVALRRRSANTEYLAHSRQRLVTQAIESVERERTRLAGALHDSPVQNLIAARHDLRRAERTGDADSFERLREAIDITITQLREEIFNLHPHVLDHVGLSAALEQVARRHEHNCDARLTIAIECDGQMAHRQVLFALGRELLDNAAKHSGANDIVLRLERHTDGVTLEVQDDGCGIAEGRMRRALLDGHIGLAAVRERVAVLGGTVSITTHQGAGTKVRVMLPDPAPTGRARTEISDRVTALDTLRVSTT